MFGAIIHQETTVFITLLSSLTTRLCSKYLSWSLHRSTNWSASIQLLNPVNNFVYLFLDKLWLFPFHFVKRYKCLALWSCNCDRGSSESVIDIVFIHVFSEIIFMDLWHRHKYFFIHLHYFKKSLCTRKP